MSRISANERWQIEHEAIEATLKHIYMDKSFSPSLASMAHYIHCELCNQQAKAIITKADGNG